MTITDVVVESVQGAAIGAVLAIVGVVCVAVVARGLVLFFRALSNEETKSG